jgi:hypothetical protein
MRRAPNLLVIACLAVGTFITIRSILDREVQSYRNETDSWPPLPKYCNIEPPDGAEGTLPKSVQRHFTMTAAAIVIRHGDRSPIHILPSNHSTAAWRCVPRPESEAFAHRNWPMTKNSRAAFSVRSLRGGVPLTRSLDSALESDGETCLPGQLTPRGVEQHLRLGQHLALALAPLLTLLVANVSAGSALPMYVRSTDYTRTLLSAASLVSGMLQPHKLPSASSPLVLHVEDEEARDVMHGVGLSSSSAGSSKRSATHEAESERAGACAKATQLAKAQIAKWTPDVDAWARLSAMYGEGIYTKLMTTGAADALFARACHAMPPPCSPHGGCVEAAVSAQVWRDADRFYCARFGGADGGRNASRLAMLPLVRDIVRRLEAAATGNGERLVLFSGHDTVVAPVVAALGGLRVPFLCNWPPYASRLVFEVWRPEISGDPSIQLQDYVRVLFNGKAITRHLFGCRARLPRSTTGVTHELCPLSNLARTVHLMAEEFAKECAEFKTT